MRITRGFALGIVAAIVAGLFVAAGQASVRGTYDDSPLTVPVGNVGDEVTYASYEKGRNSPALYASTGPPPLVGRVPPPIGGARPTKQAVEPERLGWSDPILVGANLEELRPITDRTGDERNVLLVASNLTGPGAAVVRDYVDLDTRQRVRTDWKYVNAPATVETVSTHFVVGHPRLRGLEFQGVTLQLRDDVTHLYQVPDWMMDSSWTRQVRSVVEQRARVDGHDAYGIHTAIRLVEASVAGVEPIRLDLHEMMYLSADVPYPLLTHRSFTWINGSFLQTYEEMDGLHEYRPGAVTIPWSGPPGQGYRAANPAVERSGPQRHPADGSASRLDYPLAQVIEDIENDPTLVQWYLWRQDHPGYELVGARLERTLTAGQEGLRWILWFAVPSTTPVDGNMIRITVDWQPANTATRRATEERPQRAPLFDLHHMPDQPITLAAAQHLWSAVASRDYATQRVNRIEWGLGSPSGSRTPLQALGELRVGFVGPLEGRPSDASSLVTLDVRTGNVKHLSERRVQFDCRCLLLDLQVGPRPVPPQETRVFRGLQPPTVEAAALTTTSALAVFLAAYFLPLVKFLAGQALVFLPGYAKLRKEELLGNKVREHILNLIRTDPGIHASDLARKVEAGWGTVVYHLSVLERNKLVSSLVDGRHKRFFPVGVVDFSRRGQLAVLKNETSKSIFHLIAEDPGVIQGEIAQRSGLSVPATIWHLRRLEDAGLVGRDKQGRRVHYYANKDEDIPVPYDERDAVEIV